MLFTDALDRHDRYAAYFEWLSYAPDREFGPATYHKTVYVLQQNPFLLYKTVKCWQWTLQYTTGSNFNNSNLFCFPTCSPITFSLKVGNVTMLLGSVSGFPTQNLMKNCYEWTVTMTRKYINLLLLYLCDCIHHCSRLTPTFV